MKKLLILTAAFGLFAFTTVNAQSNATTTTPAITVAPSTHEDVTSADAVAPVKETTDAKSCCKGKNTACCKDKAAKKENCKSSSSKSCCSKSKTEAKVEAKSASSAVKE